MCICTINISVFSIVKYVDVRACEQNIFIKRIHRFQVFSSKRDENTYSNRIVLLQIYRAASVIQ